MSNGLFSEFQPVSTDKWLEVVRQDLKGADFDKRLVSETLDGIKLRPFNRAEDLPATAGSVVRGYIRDRTLPTFREEIREDRITEANTHAMRSLERGAYELAVLTYPMGVPIRTGADLAAFSEGIWLDSIPIHWMSGPFTRPMLALLSKEAKRKDLDPARLQGSVEHDPIMDRCAGWVPGPAGAWKEEFKAGLEALSAFPGFNLATIRGSYIEKAGASLAQEMAFSLAIFVEYLSLVSDREDKKGLSEFVRRTEFRLGVGTNYFLEIAKLRAIKLLVQNVLDAYGVHDVRPKFHAITTSSNKTLYDSFNNLLRATVEAMACTMGGVDSLSVAAYDQGYGAPDEFSEHLTRNTETLLLDEAYVSRVADPLGGSYTVECLTRDYAECAWKLFKEIEGQGGFVVARQAGFIGDAIKTVQAKRMKQVGSRRRTIVGTSVYPNPKERRIADVKERPLAFQVSVPVIALHKLAASSLKDFETEDLAPTSPLDPFRPSLPYEELRLRIERFCATGGRRPVILLAEFGDPKMRKARSMFCQGFLGAGGYDIEEAAVSNAVDLQEVVETRKPDMVVLCSDDTAYLDFARELKIDKPVVVAGNPVDALEDLKAVGVTEFVHVRLDQIETLLTFHEKFGIPEIPGDEPLLPEAK